MAPQVPVFPERFLSSVVPDIRVFKTSASPVTFTFSETRWFTEKEWSISHLEQLSVAHTRPSFLEWAPVPCKPCACSSHFSSGFPEGSLGQDSPGLHSSLGLRTAHTDS